MSTSLLWSREREEGKGDEESSPLSAGVEERVVL